MDWLTNTPFLKKERGFFIASKEVYGSSCRSVYNAVIKMTLIVKYMI